MKSPVWFETLMLAIILLASLVSVALEKPAHRGSSSVVATLQAPSERLASGR